MSRNLWQTVLGQIFLFLSFVSNIVHLFLLKILRLALIIKRTAYKKGPNSNLIADGSNFLANKTVKLVLELYV